MYGEKRNLRFGRKVIMKQIFISSVQKEFQDERFAIRDFIKKDALLSQFFTTFLFEELPPIDQLPGEVYLDEVEKSPLYLGLFGEEYGDSDESGMSPTEKEFQRASELQKRRFIFLKGDSPVPQMKALISRAGEELVRKRFADVDALLRLLYGSLVRYLQDEGVITTRNFDAQAYEGASFADLSEEKVRSRMC